MFSWLSSSLSSVAAVGLALFLAAETQISFRTSCGRWTCLIWGFSFFWLFGTVELSELLPTSFSSSSPSSFVPLQNFGGFKSLFIPNLLLLLFTFMVNFFQKFSVSERRISSSKHFKSSSILIKCFSTYKMKSEIVNSIKYFHFHFQLNCNIDWRGKLFLTMRQSGQEGILDSFNQFNSFLSGNFLSPLWRDMNSFISLKRSFSKSTR